MRQLSDSEREAMERAWKVHLADDPELASFVPFEVGFTGGLDTAAEQVAAQEDALGSCREAFEGLEAERDGLAMQVKDLEELRDYLSNALQDEAGIQKNMHEANAYLARERKKAEEALATNVKDLSRLVKAWRDEANGHYCQTYNTGQAKGLCIAADHLEKFVRELERRADEQKQEIRH